MEAVRRETEFVDLPNRAAPRSSIKRVPGLPLTDQKVREVAEEALPKEERGSLKNICSFRNIGRAIILTNVLIAIGETASSIVSLIYAVKDKGKQECDSSISPYIANVVITGVGNSLVLLREYYDHLAEEREKNEAFIAQTTRDQLEKERYEELHQLLSDTASTLHRYRSTRKSTDFNNCLETIRNIPEGSSKYPPVREKWLAELVAASNNEKQLQKIFEKLETLGEELRASGESRLPTPDVKGTDKGEGSANVTTSAAAGQLGQNLEEYRKMWEGLETEIGFCPRHLCINGKYYDKNGNILEEESTRLKIN